MNITTKRIILVCTILCLQANIYAQGCSDAGFCTAGAMQGGKHTTDSTKSKTALGFSCSLGAGENGTLIITPQLEGGIPISQHYILEAKLPFNIASGNLGNHSGVGDVIITCSREFTTHSKDMYVTATLGSRIGVNNANASYNGMALPMPYQNSLGTTDIIAGLSMAYTKYFSIAAGYQQPVIQYNKNSYLPQDVYPSVLTDTTYFASNHLVRKGDILLRAEGKYQWKSILLAAGPLFIYHLGQDGISTSTGSKAMLKGSEGATLNLAFSISYNMKKSRLDLLGGTPFIVRDYRPDGLTRAWVVTLRYTGFR